MDEKQAWKVFKKKLDVETNFLHRDEFLKLYASKFGYKFEFPVVLAQTDMGLEVFISRNELQEINELEILIERIKSRLELY